MELYKNKLKYITSNLYKTNLEMIVLCAPGFDADKFFMLELCSLHFDYLICKTSMAIGEKWEMDAL